MLGEIKKILLKSSFAIYIRRFYYVQLQFKNFCKSVFQMNIIKEQCENIIKTSNFEIIDVFCFRFGWDAGSFQRAQHIALNMAKNKVLVFYAKNPVRDKTTEYFHKLNDNLYLFDMDNPVLMSILKKCIEKQNCKKIIHNCSTNLYTSLNYMYSFKKSGYKVLYEYIDEISSDVSGIKIPKSFYKMHHKIIEDTDNVVVSSAQILYDKVYKVRKAQNHVFACNGVEYEHWLISNDSYKAFEDITKIKNEKKPIIGYFGALANWFDYDLLRFLAGSREEYNFVLIGWEYDTAFGKSEISKLKNVHFLGPKKYIDLNSYITAFDVCTIPFLINDVTLSTSPVKLFEYLAAGKPAVCTDMPECRSVTDVFVAKTHEEFLQFLDRAVEIKDNPEFIDKFKKVAFQNSWDFKVKDILKSI